MTYYGSYRVQSEIGEGGFGDVFKVTKDNQTFAMKKVKKSDQPGEQLAEKEVKILKMVNHPHIIIYIDSFYFHGALCIVMEYADRGDMKSFIRNGNFNGTECHIWRSLAQLSDALKYLHAFKPVHIMHRDLKPANILGFTKNDGITWKLADFGISRLLNQNAQKLYIANTFAGTDIYMAPEAINENYTFSADMWSLGAVISFICNDGRNLFCSKQAVLTWPGGKSSLPSHYSIHLKQLVENLLNPDPRARPSAAQVKNECTTDRQEESTGSRCTIS